MKLLVRLNDDPCATIDWQKHEADLSRLSRIPRPLVSRRGAVSDDGEKAPLKSSHVLGWRGRQPCEQQHPEHGPKCNL